MPNGLSIGLAFPLLAPDGSAAAPAYSFANYPSTGMRQGNSNTFYLCAGGADVAYLYHANSLFDGMSLLSDNASLRLGAADDVRMARLAAYSVAFAPPPSATPNAYTVTFGGASRPGTDTNVGGANGTIRSGLGTGTGTASSLFFQVPTLAASGSGAQTYATMLQVTSGYLFASANVVLNGTALIWNSRLVVHSPADGVLTVTDGVGTSFGRLCFGGTTSSFPAIKRNGANFDLRLADDSAYCNVNCHDVIASSVYCSNVVAVGANNTNLVLGGAGVTMNLIDSAASFVIAVTGGNTIATFGGGQTLTLNLIDQGLRINNQVSGAGASTGTLTNAPSAGNPNFWLPINIAGTVRYVPCW